MEKIIAAFQVIMLFNLWMHPTAALSQPGSLDRNFAIFGVWTDPNQSAYRNIGIQPDGKIVVKSDYKIGRFNTNGSLDLSFANNGWKSLSYDPFEMAIQPDGKILTTYADKVRRYNVDGTTDESFGIGGEVIIEVFGFEIDLFSIVFDSKNRIVVAGSASFGIVPDKTTTFVFARLNPNGSLDTQLSGGGVRITLFGDGVWRDPVGCGIDPNDKIVLGIARGSNFDGDDFITRYNENGSLDTQFGGGDGTIQIGHDLDAIAVSENGKIAYSTMPKFVSGQRQRPIVGWINEFGANITLGNMDVDRISVVKFQDDGKILAAGSNSPGGGINGLYIRRFNTNGSGDQNFGEGGIVHTDLNFDIRALDILFFNKRIYIAGELIMYEHLPSNTIDHYGLLLVYDGTDVKLNCPALQPYNTDAGRCYATVNNINPVLSSTTLYANVKYKLEYSGIIEEGEGSVSGRQFQKGTTKVTYSYTDVTKQTCSFDVVVTDKEIPNITCPAGLVVNTDPGKCYAVISATGLGILTASDNCSNVTVTGPIMPENNQFPIGLTNLTWTAKDIAGNTATCTQTITVVDKELPTISIAAKSVSTDLGQCHVVLSITDLGTPVVSDNCTGYIVTEPTMPSNNIFPKGTTQLTWKVTDGSGNITTTTQTIIVSDTELPKIENLSATPGVLTLPNRKMKDVTINYTTSDNCGIASYLISNITSNEVTDGPGSANTSPDWEYVDDHHIRLRAERSATGNGRIYTITIACTDISGNITQRTVEVAVPNHTRGPNSATNVRLTTGVEIESLSEEETALRFDVIAYPNPSYSAFMLEIISTNVPAEVRVFNSAGQVIENRRSNDKTLQMGLEWKAGVYLVEVVQGINRKTIKVIKY